MVPRLLLFFFLASGVRAAEPDALDQWIAAQDRIRTLSADFTQTRTLRALKNPLKSPGKIWFRAPGDIRWEHGDPARTIFLRVDGRNWLIEPVKRRAARVEPEGMGGPGMMEFPFAKTRAELERRFRIADMRVEGRLCRLKLVPRVEGGLAEMNVVLDTATGTMPSFVMKFQDGSTLANAYSNVRINEPVPGGTFDYDMSGFEVRDAGN